MHRIGIIQPGRIGDIIICLPIAKYFHDKGYEVVWPVDYKIFKNFNNRFDYIKFTECDFHCGAAYQSCMLNWCNQILDLSFCLPGQMQLLNNQIFDSSSLSFDKLKYDIANLPLDIKYKLKINRNKTAEDNLINDLKLNNKKYCLCHLQGSSGLKADLSKINTDGLDIIEITNSTDSILDWLGVIENASKLVMIDSCFANLCNQLNLKNEKHFITRSPKKLTPEISSDWIIHS